MCLQRTNLDNTPIEDQEFPVEGREVNQKCLLIKINYMSLNNFLCRFSSVGRATDL